MSLLLRKDKLLIRVHLHSPCFPCSYSFPIMPCNTGIKDISLLLLLGMATVYECYQFLWHHSVPCKCFFLNVGHVTNNIRIVVDFLVILFFKWSMCPLIHSVGSYSSSLIQ